MNGEELAAYLASRGFVVKSVSTVDAFGNTINQCAPGAGAGASATAGATAGALTTLIRAPFSKGITDLPNCVHCKKVFANEQALANHFNVEHIGMPIPKVEVSSTQTPDTSIGSQYQIVDSSFVGVENRNTSFVIVRTVPEYNFGGAIRRARRIETKPRKTYEPRPAQEEKESETPEWHRCVVCSEIFDDCCEYSHHRREHDPNLPPGCQFCEAEEIKIEVPKVSEANPRRSSQKTGSDRRQRVSGKPKTYSCDVCSKTFAQLSNLAQHKKVHRSSDDIYPCTLCNRWFKESYQLNFHMKAHAKYEADESNRSLLDMYVTEDQLASEDVSVILHEPEE